jgi:hypothetical protein
VACLTVRYRSLSLATLFNGVVWGTSPPLRLCVASVSGGFAGHIPKRRRIVVAEVYKPDTPRNRGIGDAPHVSPVTPAEDARTILINKVSWGAVLAGAVVALVSQLILNMIGIGIGAATIDPGQGADANPSMSGFSIGAGIWWTLSGVLAALAGGYIAGRLSGQPKESTASWHGLTAWALTTLVVFYLLTSALGGIVGGAFRTVTGAAGGLASAAGGAVQTVAPAMASGAADPFASIEQALRSATGGNDPAALRDAATAAVRAAVTGDQAKAEEARERASQAVARAQNIPIDQARTQVQQYEQQYRQAVDQAKQTATRAADVAAKTVSRGALFGSLALLLGALAGWFGGRMGAVEPTVTRLGVGRA